MKKERRHDLDWIRVLVFDLLILFHVGMFFVPWEFHLKNNEVSWALAGPMSFLSQWRLPILFVVSGMGTRFALSFRSGGEFLRERFKRLLVPLAFGMLVVVPPQVYLERLVQGRTTGSFLAFYPEYFHGIYPAGNFSWHHLWFLPYLLAFSIVLTPVFLYLRDRNEAPFFERLDGLLRARPFVLYLAVVPLIFIDALLGPRFPITHAFYNDWFALPFYFTFFLYGFLLIMVKDALWDAVQRIRWITLTMGLLLYLLRIGDFDVGGEFVSATVSVTNIWSWLLALFGFAAKYLNKPSRVLAYRNQAVYPFYILHQTVMMFMAYYLMDKDLSIALKFGILTVWTFGVTWILYEFLISRFRAFFLPFGLKVPRPGPGPP